MPAIRSAALRKMAARSAKGICSHDFFASRAESMAAETSEELAPEYSATAVAWEEGSDCVWMEVVLSCFPPMTTGTWMGSFVLSSVMAAWSCALSSEFFA